MPGRLYLKIFLSFVGVILITMFLVAGLFKHTEGTSFMNRFRRLASAQVILIRTVVEEHARAGDLGSAAMQDLLYRLDDAYMARLWITGPQGQVLAQSFPGPLPPSSELAPEDPNDDHDDWDDKWSQGKDFTVVDCGDGPHCVYVTIPYGGTDGLAPGTIHCYYRDPNLAHHEKAFLLGLLGICTAVALLVMPVSWFITRRLNRLRDVALQIADGDLSRRADVCGRDEVAKVGRALNAMADSLSRMIRGSRELTANVSHELRTPLTRMRIAEEMLREKYGETGSEYLDSIREDIEALDHLIGRLLDLSKLDLKENPFTMEPVDVAEIVDGCVQRLTPIAEHRHLNLAVNTLSEATMEADGEALHTALGNLVENGIKHADHAGWLRIGLRTAGNDLSFTVENSHAPLPDEELEAIFEPFRRAKGTVSQGSGLGLAIARKIIEGHGGTIRAENIDDGVRFVVRLPRSC